MSLFYNFNFRRTGKRLDPALPENVFLYKGPFDDEAEVDREHIEGGVLMLTVYKKDRVLSPNEYSIAGNKVLCPGRFRMRPLPAKKKTGWCKMYRTLCLKTNGKSIEDFHYNKNVLVQLTDKSSFRLRVNFLIRLRGGATLYINRYTFEQNHTRFRRKLFFETNGRNILRVRPRDLEKIIYEYEGKRKEDGSLPKEESFIPGPVG